MDNGKMLFGGGESSYSFAGAKDLSELEKEKAIETFNKANKEKEDAMRANIDRELEASKKLAEKKDSMEIVPLNNYVLVRPYDKNPFEMMEEKNGILIPVFEGKFKNPDSGEEETLYNLSVQADVIEVGPACKYVKEGDVVYYRRACGVPIPFFRQGFEVVAENQIHVVVNEGIKARFEQLKEKQNGK